jgi:hypothetical protein
MKRFHGILAVLTTAFCLSWWAAAGPIRPGQAKRYDVSDEAMTMSGIERIQIQVAEIPTLLQELGIKKKRVRALLQSHLVASGIKVDEDPDLPRLSLLLVVGDDPTKPDDLAMTVIVAVHQKVLLERLNLRLTAPTVSLSKASLVSRRDASRKLGGEVLAVVDQLVRIIQIATKEAERVNLETDG